MCDLSFQLFANVSLKTTITPSDLDGHIVAQEQEINKISTVLTR